jgi:molybdate transport system substrate-binding protein
VQFRVAAAIVSSLRFFGAQAVETEGAIAICRYHYSRTGEIMSTASKKRFSYRALSSLVTVVAMSSSAIAAPAASPVEALAWPNEYPSELNDKATAFKVPKSNYVLDFHGSAHNPDLVIFMAGNQYRVLPELVREYRKWVTTQSRYQGLKTENIFYATLPPGKLIDAMMSGQLVLGNYWFDVNRNALWPDVFMTGPRQMTRLGKEGFIDNYAIYARNRGSVLLVRKGNPKNIQSVKDLARADVRVAISSPAREPASYDSYAKTIVAQTGGKEAGEQFVKDVLAKKTTVSPAFVHHRENPQFLADDMADVAPMYFHFGDYLKSRLPEVFDYVQLSSEGNAIDSFGIAQIKTSQRPRAADAWATFLRSDQAAAVFEKNGFVYAPPAERSTPIAISQ